MSTLYQRTRSWAEQAGIHPSRRLGQNFLIEDTLAHRIVATASVTPSDWVLEIGPGLGALTSQLPALGVPVLAVEKDLRVLQALASQLGPGVQLVGMDATDLDWGRLGRRPPILISNLPYPITSDLLLAISHRPAPVVRAVLMLQREVAQRIAAGPSTSERGSLSVLVQVAFRVRVVLEAPPDCFWPRPEIHSSVVRLDPLLDQPPLPAGLRPLLQRAFGQRRKTLSNSLGRPGDLLQRAGLPDKIRPQDLTNQQWLDLARLMEDSSPRP